MNHWVANLTNRIAVLGTMLFTLAACGGGGGGGGGFLPSNPNDGLTSYTITIEVVDVDGNQTSLVTATRPATLRVTILEDTPSADPVSGEVVRASAAFATITPENGQSLTDSDGIAEFGLEAGDVLGADTITLSVDSPTGTVTATVGVQVDAAGLRLGSFNGTAFVDGQIGLSVSNIAFRGTAVLRLAVVDENGASVSTLEQIRLSSNCSLAGQATFRVIGDAGNGTNTLFVETVDGLADAEYLAGDCEEEDVITAQLVGGTATASGSITIAAKTANYIGFVSADPSEGEEGADRTIIALRGTGTPGRPEVATIVFEVLEEAVVLAATDPQPGNPAYLNNPDRKPLAGISVQFSLTNDLGGITLINTSGVTDAQGLVEVDVRAGNVATSTRVIASFEASNGNGSTLPQQAISNQIVIGTGLPDQNSISLSASQFNVPDAANIDGIEVTLTVRMADRFNNPVANGTSAVFTTEYGAIDSSCLTGDSNGARLPTGVVPERGTCSVLWTSQAPRFPTFNQDKIQTIENDGSYTCPSHTGSFGPCPDDLGAIRGLRSTVLVTAVGEENFIDANGNGLYDDGEVFENLPEAFIDYNEDGVYTPSQGPQCGPPSSSANCAAAGSEEEFIDFNGDGSYSLNNNPGNGNPQYNGSLCPEDGDGVFCSRTLLNVRQSLVLTLSSVSGNLTALAANTRFAPARATDTISEGDFYEIYISDLYNNAPGAETQIQVTSDGPDCTLTGGSIMATVPDLPGKRGAFTLPSLVQVEGDGCGGGQVIVSAGGTTIAAFACVTSPPVTDPNDPPFVCP